MPLPQGESRTDLDDFLSDVDGVLATLDHDGEQVLRLHYYAGLSYSQIAAQLHIPVRDASARSARALRAFAVTFGAIPA